MSDEARGLRTAQLCRATERLREALAEVEANPLALDAAIQRFEFSYELAWKSLRAHLLGDGIEVASPREAFSQAYVQGWINDEEVWLAMLADRNRTSHTYEEALAREIGRRLPRYLESLVNLGSVLSTRIAPGD
jgi:nucleotidyltransferase substrate binding protein (TIGR01987 family)